jgi:dihydroorotate dehydrogenase electron transfer subunit
MSAPAAGPGPVRVLAEVLSSKRVAGHRHLSLVAPGVAERFRPGSVVAVRHPGDASGSVLRRTLPIFSARPIGAYGGTIELVLPGGSGLDDLAALVQGATLDLLGPLGRPFALPREPVATTLVGHGADAAPLFPLAARLRERGCEVHVLLGAAGESDLFGVLEARRAAKTVTVCTEDGSIGIRGTVGEVLPDLLARTRTDVVYAAGPVPVLHRVAAAAEDHGAWSQALVLVPMPCGTGLCGGCVVPVVGEDGLTRMVRGCAEGPVFRGDRVRWRDLARVPEDAWGAGEGAR